MISKNWSSVSAKTVQSAASPKKCLISIQQPTLLRSTVQNKKEVLPSHFDLTDSLNTRNGRKKWDFTIHGNCMPNKYILRYTKDVEPTREETFSIIRVNNLILPLLYLHSSSFSDLDVGTLLMSIWRHLKGLMYKSPFFCNKFHFCPFWNGIFVW